jgi:5-methylcytosine-specific restriction endonuclease McrA
MIVPFTELGYYFMYLDPTNGLPECHWCNCIGPLKPGRLCDECTQDYKRYRSDNPIKGDFREWLLARDGYACVECGATERLTIDHIQPVIRGGETTPDNLQTLCKSCNSRKGSNTDLEELARTMTRSETQTVYAEFVREGGGLLAGCLLSKLTERPGLGIRRVAFDIVEFGSSVLADRDVILAVLDDLVDRFIIIGHEIDPLDGDRVVVEFTETWSKWGFHDMDRAYDAWFATQEADS